MHEGHQPPGCFRGSQAKVAKGSMKAQEAKGSAKKILFITLSNIGDVIMTLPALDFLRGRFPEAKFTVILGPRPKEVFAKIPFVDKLIIYDKRARLREKIRLFNELKIQRFDIVVDLRNSFFGAFLPARYRTHPFMIIPKKIKHMRDRHLRRTQSAIAVNKQGAISLSVKKSSAELSSLFISQNDDEYIKKILRQNDIKEDDKIVVIAAGARSHIKRWPKEKFAELIRSLREKFRVKMVLVGDKEDVPISSYIAGSSLGQILDLSAKTDIAQLTSLLKRAALLITNDSAVMHLGSYLNTPTIAIFGPTDELKYGPWSGVKAAVSKEIFCRPCRKAQCRYATLDCMRMIKVEEVLRQVRDVLVTGSAGQQVTKKKEDFRRILIVRTDRIGDVLLSTPVIKVLRDSYPSAYIAMMVVPASGDIVRGNPYLDEVFIYDKIGRHKSLIGSWQFALNLKRKKFDLALILHPTNRAHLVTFFAGIPRRVGFDRKMGFLLTGRLSHVKQKGQKHELEYNLDMVRYLGIEPQDKGLFMPIRRESEEWVEEVLGKEGIKGADRLLVIHPGASCPSKIWPGERFAEAADRLAEKYGFKILLVAGPKDIKLAQNVISSLHHPVINLAGKTSVSQLASVLKRCQLVISNDSGPVHVASGVGVPVISIFGRNQKGLSPVRWGPVGKRDKILHKEVGCSECLAHNCRKDFACLKAITVDDVINAAESVLVE